MLTMTKPNGEKIKLKNKQFRKYFADLMWQHLRSTILKAIKENVKELDADGHSIVDPEFYITKVKLPSEFVFELSQKHYSDYSHFKSVISNNKFGTCDYVFGVNNLSLLERLCNILGWDKDLYQDYAWKNGRGSLAAVCLQNINKQIKLLKDEDLEPKQIDPCQYIN